MNHFTLDDVFTSPTPKDLRLPNGRTMLVHEYKLASGQAARVLWSSRFGASIALHSRLSVVAKLRALRWATEVLEQHVLCAPGEDFELDLGSVIDLGYVPAQRRTTAPVVALDKINDCDWGVRKVECRDCPTAFDPDSSPHPDRCWSCAERVDGALL